MKSTSHGKRNAPPACADGAFLLYLRSSLMIFFIPRIIFNLVRHEVLLHHGKRLTTFIDCFSAPVKMNLTACHAQYAITMFAKADIQSATRTCGSACCAGPACCVGRRSPAW